MSRAGSTSARSTGGSGRSTDSATSDPAGEGGRIDDVGGDGDSDEVDGIIAAWRRERPDLDVSPLEVLSRVSRLARQLDLRRRSAFRQHGLEPWEFDVLAALRRSGPPYRLSPGRLLTETLVTSGTMTNRVDRLEAKGLVERSADARDRRGVLVCLTPLGHARVDRALDALLGGEEALLSGLTGGRRAELAGLLRTVASSLEPPEVDAPGR